MANTISRSSHCIVFATRAEATPLIEALAAAPLDAREDGRFVAHPGAGMAPIMILVTGMGTAAVTAGLESLLADYQIDNVINAGAAGALKDELQVGEVFRIDRACTLPADSPQPTPDWIRIENNPNGAACHRLISAPAPLFDRTLREKLGGIADLIDMEGAAVADFCNRRSIPCALYKGVSDHAAEGDRRKLHDNLLEVSRRVSDRVLDHLRKLGVAIPLHTASAVNKRLSYQEALRLFSAESPNVWSDMGRWANTVREARFGLNTTFIHNLQINPSNACVRNCSFCGFAVLPGRKGAYNLTEDDIVSRIEEAAPSEVHIVGGLNYDWDYRRSIGLVRTLRGCFPDLYIKAFTAVEIDWFARQADMPIAAVLRELRQAGMNSLPGGGAEIFSERLRQLHFPRKISAERWLEIHETAHGLGIPSNATMLYGIGESREEMLTHLFRLRDLQDRTGGFQSFVPLPMQTPSDSGRKQTPSPLKNLQVIALSRLILDNIPHIKAYWPMLGVSTAAVALSWGADDLDGTIGRERIAHAAGAESPELLARMEMERLIRGAGFEPVERNGDFSRRSAPAAGVGNLKTETNAFIDHKPLPPCVDAAVNG